MSSSLELARQIRHATARIEMRVVVQSACKIHHTARVLLVEVVGRPFKAVFSHPQARKNNRRWRSARIIVDFREQLQLLVDPFGDSTFGHVETRRFDKEIGQRMVSLLSREIAAQPCPKAKERFPGFERVRIRVQHGVVLNGSALLFPKRHVFTYAGTPLPARCDRRTSLQLICDVFEVASPHEHTSYIDCEGILVGIGAERPFGKQAPFV